MSGPQLNGRAWVLMGILAVLWGTSFIFYKMLAGVLPPLTVVLARAGLAAIALLTAVALLRVPLPRSRAAWTTLAVIAVLNNIFPFALIAFAETHITSGVAAILNATTPLFGVVVAHFATRDERFNARKGLGVLLGFAGVAVLIGIDALRGIDPRSVAQLASLGAALSYAFAGVAARRLRDVPPLTTAAAQTALASLIVAPAALTIDRPWTLPAPDLFGWVAIVGIALVSTAVAYVIFFRLIAVAGASNTLLVTFLVPVAALVESALFLHEAIPLRALAGFTFILVGLIVLDGRLVRYVFAGFTKRSSQSTISASIVSSDSRPR